MSTGAQSRRERNRSANNDSALFVGYSGGAPSAKRSGFSVWQSLFVAPQAVAAGARFAKLSL